MGETGTGQDWSAKTVFSTGEAAEVCGVSQQTIIRCFDKGRLQGFRVPGSKFRRIPRDELLRFMRENAIPLARIEGRHRVVLCLGSADSVVARLSAAVSPRDRLDVMVASTGFDAGWAACASRPIMVLVDGAFDTCVAMSVLERLTNPSSIVAVVGDGDMRALGRAYGAAIAHRLEAGLSVETLEQRIVAILDDAESGVSRS